MGIENAKIMYFLKNNAQFPKNEGGEKLRIT